ncbi:hypothetical protein HPC62_02135 [Thermoleptolyngbya sichuanensis A183]|uniref:Lipoprotein n=1 Tax=Thermoleptolyngbya sichuanensis A183 TaxID=2737172 RepID=A0A6M8BCY4_9CYAN|nr:MULTISPECIES: hypothetical protein [Thermoleptolyngbya]QKD81133.1 hypothetical protein HPC62_02135 [Thermoleptolyngbya sichuanensis A183]
MPCRPLSSQVSQPAWLVSLLFASLVLGCTPLVPPPVSSSLPPAPTIVQPDSPFQLPLAGTATLPNQQTLTFVRVEQDSRCPSDVTCVWPGQAEVIVTLSQPGQPAQDLLLTQRPGDEAAARSVNGLTVKLIDLLPYPTTGPSSPADYTVTLLVTQP